MFKRLSSWFPVVLLVALVVMLAAPVALAGVAAVAPDDLPGWLQPVISFLTMIFGTKTAFLAPAWLVLVVIPLVQVVKVVVEKIKGTSLGETAAGRLAIAVLSIAVAFFGALTVGSPGEGVTWGTVVQALEAGFAAYWLYKPLWAKPATP